MIALVKPIVGHVVEDLHSHNEAVLVNPFVEIKYRLVKHFNLSFIIKLIMPFLKKHFRLLGKLG